MDFEGLARVLTILARGYLWERGEPDPDYARRALCAWCSTPERKNAGDTDQRHRPTSASLACYWEERKSEYPKGYSDWSE